MTDSYLGGQILVHKDIRKKKVKITFNVLRDIPEWVSQYNMDVRKFIIMLSETSYHYPGIKQILQDYMPEKRILLIIHTKFQADVEKFAQALQEELISFGTKWEDLLGKSEIKKTETKRPKTSVINNAQNKELEKVEAVYP